MKNYTFILIPEKEDREKIESIRMKYTGHKLVDALPPHVSFKRRFWLTDDFVEKDLKKVLNEFQIAKITLLFNRVERLDDTTVLVADRGRLLPKHKQLLELLKGKVITKNPKWESESFKAHLTLFRNSIKKDIKLEKLGIKKITFNTFCLYEIDSSPTRSFANKIECKGLH